MSRFNYNIAALRRPVACATLAATAVLAACDNDAPTSLTSPLAASASKTGAGKPSTVETVVFTGTVDFLSNHIYAMNPDGSNIRRLTSDSARDEDPSLSPDNRKIVWVRRTPDGTQQIFTANRDGTKQIALTAPHTNVAIQHPRFSPDGTRIAFGMMVPDSSALGEPNGDIYTINADGSGLARLTYEPSLEIDPSWSPDGKTIVFASTRSAGYTSIYMMTAGGLNVRNVVACGQNCLEPEFSPDGGRIAFASTTTGEIFVIDLATQLIAGVGPRPDVGVSRSPTWTKDGTRVVFASDRGAERNMELYEGTPGSSEASSVRRLTLFSPGAAFAPSYSH